MKILFFIFYSLVLSSVINAQSIGRSFARLAQKDLYSAHKGFSKKVKRYPAAAAVGMASCFLEPSFRDIDSSLKYLLIAENNWESIPSKMKLKLNKVGVSKVSVLEMKERLATLFYERCKEINDADCFDFLMSTQPWNYHFEQIKYYRDSLLYVRAVENKSSADIKLLLEVHPDSPFKSKLDALHDQFQLNAYVKEGTEEEWESFIEAHPENRYSEPIQDSLYALFDRNRDYALFIEKYPENRNVNVAWQNLYMLETNYYQPSLLPEFAKSHPDFPDKNRLDVDLKLANMNLYPFQDTLKNEYGYGYLNENGDWIIQKRNWFHEPTFFKQGLAVMGSDGLYGVIDKRGVVIVPYEYEEVTLLDNASILVAKNGLYGVLNRDGSIRHALKYSDVLEVNKDFYALYLTDTIEIFNSNSKTNIDVQCTDMEVFEKGFYKLWHGSNVGLFQDSSDIKLVMCIPTVYDELTLYSKGICLAEYKNSLKLLDFKGALLKDLTYTDVTPVKEGFAIATTAEGQINYLDAKGQKIFESDFEYFNGVSHQGCFNNGFAIVKKDGFFGIIDTSGAFKVKPQYEQLIYLGGLYGYKNREKWSIFSMISDTVNSGVYESLDALGMGMVLFKQEGKYGVMNNQFKVLLSPNQRSIKRFNDYFVVLPCGDDLSYIYDVNGNVISKVGYEKIQPIDEEHLLLSLKNKISYFRVPDGKLIQF